MRSCFVLLLGVSLSSLFSHAFAQQASIGLHSHNDYEKPVPFWNAYHNRFGSVEADVFLEQGTLLVAHERKELNPGRTLENLYFRPLDSLLKRFNGHIANNEKRTLQLMIDIKSESKPALNGLLTLLEKYPSIRTSPDISIVISGNRPPVNELNSYPAFILFDGEADVAYPSSVMGKIAMLSDNFRKYTRWNGMGVIPAREKNRIDSVITAAHVRGKKIRFWNAPDIINTWYHLLRMGADWINTDHIPEAGAFLQTLPSRAFRNDQPPYPVYQPSYKSDGATRAPKNIILLIGDGTGLPQWYAGYTANHGALNVFSFRHTGLSKTSSYDSYITDSAPGSGAFSMGEKTNNRAIGVDHTGAPLPLLPGILKKKGKSSAIITCGDMSDATPADFYAHNTERSNSAAIIRDLPRADVDILMGAAGADVAKALTELPETFKIVPSLDAFHYQPGHKWVVSDPQAAKHMQNGRGPWLGNALDKAIAALSSSKEGFFIMAEAAQVDHGGHDNHLPYLVTEVLDLDQAIARALRFADTNGETLVIVTADHETGGLTLLSGDYKTGFVSGQFSTNDHTALPVPVFAYGPGAQWFTGVYENTEVFHKILKALGGK